MREHSRTASRISACPEPLCPARFGCRFSSQRLVGPPLWHAGAALGVGDGHGERSALDPDLEPLLESQRFRPDDHRLGGKALRWPARCQLAPSNTIHGSLVALITYPILDNNHGVNGRLSTLRCHQRWRLLADLGNLSAGILASCNRLERSSLRATNSTCDRNFTEQLHFGHAREGVGAACSTIGMSTKMSFRGDVGLPSHSGSLAGTGSAAARAGSVSY